MEKTKEELIQWGTNEAPIVWPDNLYNGVLIRIEEFEGKYGLMWRLFFEVKKGVEMATFPFSIGQKPTSQNKSGKALIALGFKEGEAFSPSQFIGIKAKLLIQTKPITYNGQSITKSVIDKIMGVLE